MHLRKLSAILYIILSIVLLTDFGFYMSRNISLPGSRPEWVLFWLWIVSTIIIILSQWKMKWVKVYSLVLVVLVIITMLPMMIPFLSLMGYAFDPDDKRYKVTDTIELSEHQKMILARPTIVAIQSFGLYEKIVGETEVELWGGENYVDGYNLHLKHAQQLKLFEPEKNDSLRIEFIFGDGSVVRTFTPLLY